MSVFVRLIQSSVGKKYLMAITGVGLFVFAIGHMLGNLQIFLGREAINRYGHFLQSTPEILWPARVALLAFVVIHIWTSVALTLENRAAREAGYALNKVVDASYASRTMMISGFIIAAFVIYHLLHFTVQVKAINLTGQDFLALHDLHGRHDVYQMMVTGFSNGWVSSFYLVAIALLCFHLSHGVSAMFQSLGLNTDSCETVIDRFAKVAAVIIFAGYASVPAAILAGIVK
jgi:succinate dehydrogenase / fumarate reductase cytochrome b subunit